MFSNLDYPLDYFMLPPYFFTASLNCHAVAVATFKEEVMLILTTH